MRKQLQRGWRGVERWVSLSLFVLLLNPSYLLASVFVGCCELRLYTPESNPLLTILPNLEISPTFHPSDNTFLLSPLPPEEAEKESVQQITKVAYNVPITFNGSVDEQIAFFQTIFKERFEKGLSLSGRYIPIMQEIFMEFNLPTDLAYLPLIESSFNVKAVSRVKATGLWQFMKATARRYGLRIDSWIDERRDPIKSTKAAARYLKDLYEMFDSWLLSLASYNAGERRIEKAMTATSASDFWELKEAGILPRETEHFVPKFIAATIIAKNSEEYGFFVDYEPPLLYDEVEIRKQTSLHAISRATGVSVEEIKAYNPELKKGSTPPNYPRYRLKLPVGKKEVFLANLSKVKEYRIEKGVHRHQIKKGETITSISKKYGITTKRLLKANRLHKNSIIRAGHFLLIPRA